MKGSGRFPWRNFVKSANFWTVYDIAKKNEMFGVVFDINDGKIVDIHTEGEDDEVHL